MSYGNQYSNKPFERASKTAHTNIINDELVKEFIKNCHIPPFLDNFDETDLKFNEILKLQHNPIKNIITIDGGYTEVIIKEEYPSSKFAFFQFGALFFKYMDLISIKTKPFIDPSDFSKLQNIQRIKMAIPTKGITLKGEIDFVSSVRKAIYLFFMNSTEENGLMSSLKWLIFNEYNKNENVIWHLATCPHCTNGMDINKNMVNSDYTFSCPHCRDKVYLTDVFRLHEPIDNELGAGGILGYLSTTVEQMIIVYLIKSILETKPSLLNETLIIKDGPLAFFGQTANIYKPMRNLITYLNKNYTIYLVGLEKSGAFVEHAEAISSKIGKGKALIMTNRYIYKYILPGNDNDKPYGSSTYYGNKLIYKSEYDNIYIATIPTLFPNCNPIKSDLLNIDVILNNVAELKCDLYYNSLVPIVMANKLVSLADHPSADLLKQFSQDNLSI
jgi:hypothetical protein